MWRKSKLDKELNELAAREAILRTIEIPQKKRFALGLWIFLAVETSIAFFAISLGFVEWYIDGFVELIHKPILSLSIADLISLIFRAGIFCFVVIINYIVLKNHESEDDC